VLGEERPLPGNQRESLPAGSYRITASAGGREVQEPLNLAPGERLFLPFSMPEGVPQGFVFVPAGRFFFATSADESVREFFNTVPIHPVRMGAFLIAREEVTYADWIAFLEALPPDQREAHRPHVGSVGLTGDLDLALAGGHWQLSLAVGDHHYLLHDGDTWQLPGRARAVDWHMLPVAGISYADAKAYAAWLASSGRVKGARLCSEAEWERAARGADAREYPMGDLLTPDLAIYDLTYGKRPE
jgi:formylglycine-generating enzyme required for sulfatase activity